MSIYKKNLKHSVQFESHGIWNDPMEYNGRSLMESLKTGDACLDLEHTSCGMG